MITSDFPARCLPTGPVEPAPGRDTSADARTLAELRQPGGRPVLIKGAIILSQDPAVGDYAAGDILIRDGKIAQVGEDLARQAGGAVVIDAAGTTTGARLACLTQTRWTATACRSRAPVVVRRSYWHRADTGRVRHNMFMVVSNLAYAGSATKVSGAARASADIRTPANPSARARSITVTCPGTPWARIAHVFAVAAPASARVQVSLTCRCPSA